VLESGESGELAAETVSDANSEPVVVSEENETPAESPAEPGKSDV
jgi:hypothetical protein